MPRSTSKPPAGDPRGLDDDTFTGQVIGQGDDPGSAIEVRRPGGDVVEVGQAVATLTEWLAYRAEHSDIDNGGTMEAMVAAILAGGSAEEILTENLAIGWKEIVDQPILLRSFDVSASDFEDGSPFYAVLKATWGGDPMERAITVGGIKVLAKLMMLEMTEAFPVPVRITATVTKKGHTVLDLLRPKG